MGEIELEHTITMYPQPDPCETPQLHWRVYQLYSYIQKVSHIDSEGLVPIWLHFNLLVAI